MVKEIFENYNIDDLIRLRAVLLDGENKERLLKELDRIHFKHNNTSAPVGKDIRHLLEGFKIESLYLNKRIENNLIAAGCNTILDVSKIENLKQVPQISTISIKNIKINMMFIEKYLYELCDRNRGAKVVECDPYDEKYGIVVRSMSRIFDYLEKHGEEFFFGNSERNSVVSVHQSLKHIANDGKPSKDEYRIMRCLSEFSFLSDLERVADNEIGSYKCFDKFITKKRV